MDSRCDAICLANERGKATYITVNNLLDENESSELSEYLHFLSEIKPTGIIVQDFAVLEQAKALKSDLEMHASPLIK